MSNLSVVANDRAPPCSTHFRPLEYLALDQSPYACAVQALHHRYDYLAIRICGAVLTLNIQGVESGCGTEGRGKVGVIMARTEFSNFPLQISFLLSKIRDFCTRDTVR